MNSKNLITALALTALAATGAGAQTASVSELPLSAPTVQKVIVENVYYFAHRKYEPAVPVVYVGADATYGTPEAATIAAISAMKTKNVSWFRSMWDKPSQQMMADRDKQFNQTPEFWQNAWEKVFAGNRRAVLTDRIDSGDYVIISYSLLAPEPDAKPIELSAILKHQGGRWMLTQDLASDPVLLNWRTPNERMQRIVRNLMPETGAGQ